MKTNWRMLKSSVNLNSHPLHSPRAGPTQKESEGILKCSQASLALSCFCFLLFSLASARVSPRFHRRNNKLIPNGWNLAEFAFPTFLTDVQNLFFFSPALALSMSFLSGYWNSSGKPDARSQMNHRRNHPWLQQGYNSCEFGYLCYFTDSIDFHRNTAIFLLGIRLCNYYAFQLLLVLWILIYIRLQSAGTCKCP